jgi:membrane protease YdiL (CAAX protease family)
MPHKQSVRFLIIAIMVFQIFALFAQAFLQGRLQEGGLDLKFARDLSYLVVPPMLVTLMFSILKANKELLLEVLNPRTLSTRIVLSAIAIGVLARIAWWSQMFLRVSSGLTQNPDPAAIEGPIVTFACPAPGPMLLALLVWGCLIPVTEEVINRGLIQSWLMHRGRVFAIAVSAVVFAVFHPPSTIPFAFVFGIITGTQFSNTKTLWAVIITHATFDLLVLFDWRCLHTVWNPPASDLPMVGIAAASLASLAIASAMIVVLLKRTGSGVRFAPRS